MLQRRQTSLQLVPLNLGDLHRPHLMRNGFWGEQCTTCSGASDTMCADPWQSVLEGLVQKNHVTQLLRSPDSVVQVVVRQGERLCAESDPRKGGYPAGYWCWPPPSPQPATERSSFHPETENADSITKPRSQNSIKLFKLNKKRLHLIWLLYNHWWILIGMFSGRPKQICFI